MQLFSEIRIVLNILYSYGISLLCSYKTKQQLKKFLVKYSAIYGVKLIAKSSNASHLIELDTISIGNSCPISIYIEPPYDNPVWTDQQRKFLEAYKKGNWKVAKFYVNGLPNNHSTGLRNLAWRGRLSKYYDVMLERMEEEPPNDWNGVLKV